MIQLYQNYNTLYLSEEKDSKTIVKIFHNEFCWNNETKAILALGQQGLPVPEILETKYLKNTYKFTDGENYEEVLKKDTLKITELLTLKNEIMALPIKELYHFRDRKNKFIEKSNELYEQKLINDKISSRLIALCKEYAPSNFCFVHGDFRPANFIENGGMKGIIDLEFAGIDDPHKDMAYLWVGAVAINKDFNHLLKSKFQEYKNFSPISFNFWLCYMHLMIINNPKTVGKDKWADNLEQILNV